MMIRKITDKILFAAGMIALLIPALTGCNMEQEGEKFIGLQLYSVRDAMKEDVQGTIAQVGDIGYKYVEAAGYSNGQFYGMPPEDFRKLIEDNGMQFLGSHTGQNAPDSASLDKTMAWWDEAIQAHSDAGVKWIVQPSMGRAAYESLDGLKRYCEYFNAVGEKCNEKGIRFGYHNHDNEFTTEFEGKPVYDWMLQLTDPEKVMFQLDLYWIVEGGKNPVEYFKQYPGRFEVWHIKDEEELGASGKMDFETIFANREQAGAEYGVVEVEKYNFEPIESVRRSFDFLQQAEYVDFKE